MENLVGKKMRGFAYCTTKDVTYDQEMDKHIGEVGKIVGQNQYIVSVQFKYDGWAYPLPEALQHIVEEPTIPELKQVVEMEVSHDGQRWFEQYIIAVYRDTYISNVFATYKYARPIQPKKLTMAELETLVGGKFEIINEE